MTSPQQHRRPPRPHHRAPRPAPDDDAAWIWGTHAARAALANPGRDILRVLATRNAARALGLEEDAAEIVEPSEIDALLPPGAAHQGIAVRATAPPPVPLETLAEAPSGVIIVLDQVTDPHNAGAVLRSAAAFGAVGVVMQDRKAPPLSGACAKAAVGAAERVPNARVVNLSRALESLREAGWTALGLAGDAETDLADAVVRAPQPRIVLALGSEDKGLRPSVAKACDTLARIPICDAVESLNVSNAAAIALYAAAEAVSKAKP